MSQPQACEWIKKLTPQVNAVLGRELLLPARRPADLDTLLTEVPELRLLVIDGVERPVRRPKDKDDQKKNYSGKKKAHRKKNLLISSEKRVVYLGPTSPGSVHDKKLADESGLSYPSDALVVKDTGFQGYEPPDTTPSSPRRSHADANSTPSRRPSTKSSAKCGSPSNTPSAGIKRCHIVADLFRNRRRGFVDEVMLAASGLHNLRVATPHRLNAPAKLIVHRSNTTGYKVYFLKRHHGPHSQNQRIAIAWTAAGVDDILQVRLDGEPRGEIRLISDLDDGFVIRQRVMGALEAVGLACQSAQAAGKVRIGNADAEHVAPSPANQAAVVQARFPIEARLAAVVRREAGAAENAHPGRRAIRSIGWRG